MAYPDWVMEHKKKGMYVNKVNETTYRIYRGHSERVKGTSKVKRIVDEYIGTITQSEGLIRSKPKVKGEVRSVRCGGYALMRWFCTTQMEGILRRSGDEGPMIVAGAIVNVLYGQEMRYGYENDWVSVVYPGISFPLQPRLKAESERAARGMKSTLRSHLGEGLPEVLQACSYVSRVWVNGQWVDAAVSPKCRDLARTYGFRWEVIE
ncbi:MAG: hypothetical protein JXK93_13195 [Sphaerochaetaceae bacterium]|nr:hypothetical protein [Sphaerochaetaceae bacterium]